MACLAQGVTAWEAAGTSIVVTAIYVSLLYLPFNNGPRDNRRVILRRVITLTALAVVVEVYLRTRVPGVNTYNPHGARYAAFFTSAFLTLLLYTGHLAVAPVRRVLLITIRSQSAWPVAFRNYVAAPLLEEMVFRRQTLLLWSCAPPLLRLLFPAIMFAMAHVHHIRRLGVVTLLFHLAYTFLFGVYAAALYLNTRTVWAPYAAHVVCNVLEIPDFAAIAAHPRSKLISAVYGVSIVLFAVCFGPVTALLRPYDLASE